MSQATEQATEPALERGWVGQSIRRKEDERLVRGDGTFFDDLGRKGMGYLHFVRSPYAHARIVSVDVSAAESIQGVYGTLTPDEVVELTDPFFQLTTAPGNLVRDYALAVGKTRHAGEPVVAVVAETRDVARDAADAVVVEYEPLPVLVDAERALDEDAPVLHDEASTNLVWSGQFDYGDIDGALRAADHVVRISRLHFHRFASTPLECAGALVEYDPGTTQFTLYCNHQMPGVAAVWMAPAMRVGVHQLRFVTQDIGGAFGNKISFHPQLTAAALLARKLRRPVQWTEWRTDQHQASSHGNERTFLDIEVAVQSDGTMLGFKATMLDDAGAFPRYEPLGCIIWAQVLPGVFRWRNIHVDFAQVVTNKSPVGPNRGYSRQQHNWFCERVLELVARELDLDPVEMRRRNYIRHEDMPYETPNGCVYDSGDYEACLDLALDLIDHVGWKNERARSGRVIGIGVGSTLDSGTNNFGQSQLLNPALQFSGNNEVATIKLETFGEIVVTLGTTPQGQGHETTAAQVAADILGVDPEQVFVRVGHDSYWNSHAAFSGTYASQFAVTGLGAVKGAAEELVEQIRRLAGLVLGASPNEVILDRGRARLESDPDAALPFSALGAMVNAGNAGLPNDLTLNCRYVYVPPFEVPDLERRFGNLCLTYAFACHAAVIELDPDTGELSFLDYSAVHDCGTQIHPQIIEGQLHGGLAQALGAALWESFVYDDQGQLLTSNFYDYHVPHALDMPTPKVGHIESPSPFTPLGAKGGGEGGGCATLAITSAIQDALRHAGGGTVDDSYNPPERIWRLLHQAPEAHDVVEVLR